MHHGLRCDMGFQSLLFLLADDLMGATRALLLPLALRFGSEDDRLPDGGSLVAFCLVIGMAERSVKCASLGCVVGTAGRRAL